MDPKKVIFEHKSCIDSICYPFRELVDKNDYTNRKVILAPHISFVNRDHNYYDCLLDIKLSSNDDSVLAVMNACCLANGGVLMCDKTDFKMKDVHGFINVKICDFSGKNQLPIKLRKEFRNSGRVSPVMHPICGNKKVLNKAISYCYLCGNDVYNQRFCQKCGALLDWSSLGKINKIANNKNITFKQLCNAIEDISKNTNYLPVTDEPIVYEKEKPILIKSSDFSGVEEFKAFLSNTKEFKAFYKEENKNV